jgi:hypothetical protein
LVNQALLTSLNQDSHLAALPLDGRIWQIVTNEHGSSYTSNSGTTTTTTMPSLLAEGLRLPVNGLAFHGDHLYVSKVISPRTDNWPSSMHWPTNSSHIE